MLLSVGMQSATREVGGSEGLNAACSVLGRTERMKGQVVHAVRPPRVTSGRQVVVCAAQRKPVVMKSGGSVLDKPTSTTPDSEKKSRTARKRPPMYRVILHNDNFNRREYVVQVLLKVVDGLTVDDAVNVMQEAHMNGLSLVTCCAQEVAEQYCQGLRNNGLTSTIEPDNGSGSQ